MKENIDYSYITLLSSESYLKSVLVLNRSLQVVKSKHPLYVMLSKEIATNCLIFNRLLQNSINTIIIEDEFSIDKDIINKISTKNWINTFEKLNVFSLTQFKKVIFIDSDILVIKNIDHLFEKKSLSFACASGMIEGYEDWNLPNSGLMIIEPTMYTSNKIFNTHIAVSKKLSNFSDQNLIHEYFKEYLENRDYWQIETKYNSFVFIIDKICKQLNYTLDSSKDNSVYCLHFCCMNRPWRMNYLQFFIYISKKLVKLKIYEAMAYIYYFRLLRNI